MGKDTNVRSDRSSGAPNSSQPTAKRQFGGISRGTGSAHFREIDELGATIDALIGAGDAVMFARTSDGGAIVVTLLRDKQRDKQYPVHQEELVQVFDWLRDEYMGG